MPKPHTATREDRDRVLRKLVASDPTFTDYSVVEIVESETGNKLTIVLVKKEIPGTGSLADPG